MKMPTHPLMAIVLPLLWLSASASGAGAMDDSGMHAHHHMMEQTTHRLLNYQLPEVQLVRADGNSVSFNEELNDGRPVVLNFIYTTCTTICPLTSRVFAELQDKLGTEPVHMISISTDPEQDTPEVLSKYAHKFGAGRQWQFYTGTMEASIAIQRAFGIYRGDKMDHNPVTFIRSAPGKPWLRIDGFAKPEELLQALHNMQTSREAQSVGSLF